MVAEPHVAVPLRGSGGFKTKRRVRCQRSSSGVEFRRKQLCNAVLPLAQDTDTGRAAVGMHDLANDEQSKIETCSLGLRGAASTAVQRLEQYFAGVEVSCASAARDVVEP
jgi:hypothetical protein